VASDSADRAPLRSTFGAVAGTKVTARRQTSASRRSGTGSGANRGGKTSREGRGRGRGGKGSGNGSGAPRAPKPLAGKLYCGVTEFSAPIGTAFLPSWMFPALRLKEGGRISVCSAKNPPKGEFARFRPHKTAFIDLAAAFGPRELMEQAMKQYSTLSKGRTVLVEAGGDRYLLDVLELRPADSVSLYGDLDLEVDFAPPKDMEDEGQQEGSGMLGMGMGIGMGMGMGMEGTPGEQAAGGGAGRSLTVDAGPTGLGGNEEAEADGADAGPMAGQGHRIGGSSAAGAESGAGDARSPVVAATREARAAARLRRIEAAESRRR